MNTDLREGTTLTNVGILEYIVNAHFKIINYQCLLDDMK